MELKDQAIKTTGTAADFSGDFEVLSTKNDTKTFLQQCREARDNVGPRELETVKQEILKHYRSRSDSCTLRIVDEQARCYVASALRSEGFLVRESGIVTSTLLVDIP
jgi:hypothetical protein